MRCIPDIWKRSCIIPVPKKSVVSCMNDVRPVALTSIPMKCCERIVLNQILPLVTPFLDPFQFAYQQGRNTEDAILVALESIYNHLEKTKTGSSIRIMFFDFSSAFNTIQPHLLAQKLMALSAVPHSLIFWLLEYLTNRTQFVKLSSNVISTTVISNTGAPQGTVLAPFLFTLYTADGRCDSTKCHLVKFADDTALIGYINNDDSSEYLQQVSKFTSYCDENFLELNVNKTKEMLIDFRKKSVPPDLVRIKDSVVERVETYKYLGVYLESTLCWSVHIDSLIKKLNVRMYCLRKLSTFGVNRKILLMFYNSVICGVWYYCLLGWAGNASKTDKSHINCIVRRAEKITGEKLMSVDCAYNTLLKSKFNKIWNDRDHPLYAIFKSCLIPRSGRFRMPISATTTRHPLSFVPQAMRLYNTHFKR